MKAGIYLGKENVEIRNLPLPEVGDNDVLVKNLYSSICGTDVAVFTHGPDTGHKITVGGEFGHETVSEVVKIGKNVTEFSVGERVYPYPRFAKGDTTRAGTIGGFSEYILIPKAVKNHSLYNVDPKISSKLASLTEPFTVGCRAARRAAIPHSGNAVVFGCGTIGIAAAVALKHFGAARVMICDVSDFRLNIACSLGFAVCNVQRENFLQKATAYFSSAPSVSGSSPNIDCWIDAAGAPSVLDDFINHGKTESRFVSVAVNNRLRQINLLRMTYSQQSIIGSGGYMPEDFYTVQEIMSSPKWDLEKIITHEFSLDNLTRAIKTASDVSSALNVIIKF